MSIRQASTRLRGNVVNYRTRADGRSVVEVSVPRTAELGNWAVRFETGRPGDNIVGTVQAVDFRDQGGAVVSVVVEGICPELPPRVTMARC